MKYDIMCNIFLYAPCYITFIRPAWKIKANKCQKNVNISLKCAEFKKKTISPYKHGAKTVVWTSKKRKNWHLTRKQQGFVPFRGKKMSNRQVFHLIALKNTHQIDIR